MHPPEHDLSPSFQLITVAEAARILAHSERWLRKMIADKKISVVRIKRRVVIAMSELESFIRNQNQ